MKKKTVITRNLLVLLAILCPTVFCLTLPVAGEANEALISPDLSLAGTLWKVEDYDDSTARYFRFLDTPTPKWNAKDKDNRPWLEVVIYDYDEVRRGNIWLLSGSELFINTAQMARYEGDVVDEKIIKGLFQTVAGRAKKFTLTLVTDPEILKRYEDIDRPKVGKRPPPPINLAKHWNLKKDDLSLERTLWKFQRADGSSALVYWNLSAQSYESDGKTFNRLFMYNRYNMVFTDSWRQEGSKVSFFTLWGDYEGELIDWATIKGVYHPKTPADGKTTSFKLFRVIEPKVLERYVDAKWPKPAPPNDMYAVRIDNPNNFSVSVLVRNITGPDNPWTGMETSWSVSPNDSGGEHFPDGKYEIFFTFSNEPKAKYKGDNFSVSGGGIEIKLVKASGGNYGIRRVQ